MLKQLNTIIIMEGFNLNQNIEAVMASNKIQTIAIPERDEQFKQQAKLRYLELLRSEHDLKDVISLDYNILGESITRSFVDQKGQKCKAVVDAELSYLPAAC